MTDLRPLTQEQRQTAQDAARAALLRAAGERPRPRIATDGGREMAAPTFISLFAGIGGIDLAFEAAGWQCIGQVEINEFCTEILSKRWPDVPRWRDVRTVTGRSGKGWARYHQLPRPDAIVGGFPCQDISVAGKRAGILAGARSGLWFEFARLIGELRPRIVLLENVPAITTRDGAIVLAGLAEMGYDARWGVISASDAGAGHLRERWFCVANAPRTIGDGTGDTRGRIAGLANESVLAHPDRERLAQRGGERGDAGGEQPPAERGGNGELAYPDRLQRGAIHSAGGGRGDVEPRLGRDADGLPAWMDRSYTRLHVSGPGEPQHVWEPPRTTDRRDYRAKRLTALGNAVVPGVVYPIAVMMREWLETDH